MIFIPPFQYHFFMVAGQGNKVQVGMKPNKPLHQFI
jgi:hypothetical protein